VRRARTLAAWGLVAGLTCAACGSSRPADVGAPRPVPAFLVPAALPSEGLTIQPNTTLEVRQAIASVGPQLLVSDARLWELHLGAQLVGALQLATLKERIDPAHAADRNAIIGQILPGETEEIDINGLPVWTTPDDGSDRSLFIWFGAHIFGVLQLKGDGVDPPRVADDLIGHIAAAPAWQALPPQAYILSSSVSGS